MKEQNGWPRIAGVNIDKPNAVIIIGKERRNYNCSFFANILILLVGKGLKTLCCWRGGGAKLLNSAECFIVPL